ncbi:MAG: hypothetical protein Q8O83_04955 [bacterium]|nr:hypothetical protein [bacterium]
MARFHCPECGRFANKQYVDKNGYCEACAYEGYLELLEEEAELDPTGPAYAVLTGDDCNLRRGYR